MISLGAPPVPATTMTRVLLDNVKCLDGSPAGYYVDGTASSKWVFWLEGGGACFTEADCEQRARTALGSSTKWKGFGQLPCSRAR